MGSEVMSGYLRQHPNVVMFDVTNWTEEFRRALKTYLVTLRACPKQVLRKNIIHFLFNYYYTDQRLCGVWRLEESRIKCPPNMTIEAYVMKP